MENLNKKNSAENLNVNSQTNANASKNNLLKWVVIENFEENDFLMCAVYECGVFQYRIKVAKNAKLKNVDCGDVIKNCIVEYNYISPDGFVICSNNFEKQGYYSSSKYGKIPLSELENFCEIERIIID